MADIIGLPKGKVGNTVMLIISIAVIALIVVLVVKIMKGLNTGSKIVGNTLEDVAISNQTGVPKERITALKDVADYIDKGVYRMWLTGVIMFIEDDYVVNGCNRCVSDKEAKVLSQLYKQKTGNSLRYDIIEASAVDTASRNKIIYKNAFY